MQSNVNLDGHDTVVTRHCALTDTVSIDEFCLLWKSELGVGFEITPG